MIIQRFWATVQSVLHTMRNVLLRNTEYVARWFCYLFKGYIFFTLLNMQVIILVNILYLSFISRPPGWEPKARSSSIDVAIDLMGIPDLSDNIYIKKTFVSHLFSSTVFADFYLNSVIFSHYFTSRCSCKLSYSLLLINVLRFIIVCYSFLTDF